MTLNTAAIVDSLAHQETHHREMSHCKFEGRAAVGGCIALQDCPLIYKRFFSHFIYNSISSPMGYILDYYI